MKKAVRRTLLAGAAVGVALAVGLATTTVVNVVATGREAERIEPYGQSVTVDGRQMNVLVTGSGPVDVVLLPGFGTPSPVLDFEPLIMDLARDHRVIVVEPFGYGLSDATDVERTTENIVTEVHAALEALDVERYVLMGHSIAGVYGIEYAARYRDEVTAFVGIDTSVPGQPHTDTRFPTGLMAAAKNLGLVRVLTAFGDGGLDGSVYSDHAREQMTMLTHRNSLGPTYLDEMGRIGANFERALGTTFPADLPLLLFVEADNANNPDWLALHEEQAATVDDGAVIPVPGEHYLHHTHAPEIAADFREWAGDRGLTTR
jgi:pimeloyl-ACP methyl ester carboxylesterase